MPNRGKKAGVEELNDILIQEAHEVEPIDSEEVIFALDIGTRNVVGVVGIEEDGMLKIIDSEILEHSNRAMLDGQIHDVSRVSEVVEIVKEKLESRLGFNLTTVAIAAAGRVLRTHTVKVDRKLEGNILITQEMVNSLELEGIQLAQSKLQEENANNDSTNYYCVGHTVINYYLNGYVISNLVGHKGKSMSANVLATFLPQTVVDSLYSVMERVGLKVVSLTLEPIAAINVSIPQDLRLLNIALVDVGAGTSDIAITREGSIVAYGMCPVAGDEVTERISQHYLLDFNTAEKVKVQLGQNKTVEFEDILGFKREVKSTEIIEVIEPVVGQLAEVIAEKILACNGKAPSAVMCIGGGSQTPGLTKIISEKLELDTERVGVRGSEIIKNIRLANKNLIGPESITPIGIAATALMQRGHDFIQVKVNKKVIRLFNAQKLTVEDAVALVGFTPDQLIPTTGKSIVFELNGRNHTVKGGYGKPAEITVNGQSSSLDTAIGNGDQIKVIPSVAGVDAAAFVEDFVHDHRVKKILFNGIELDITSKAIINNKLVTFKQAVENGDKLHVEEIKTIKDLAKFSEISLEKFNVTVNGSKVSDTYVIQPDDVISAVSKEIYEEVATAKTAVQERAVDLKSEVKEEIVEETISSEVDTVNIEENIDGEAEEASVEDVEEYDSHTEGIVVTINGERTNLKGKESFIFIDIFNVLHIDLSEPRGNVVLKLNGMAANFTDTIKHGDNIQVLWEKNQLL